MSDPNEPVPPPVPEPVPADPMSVDRQSIEGIFVEALGKATPDERRAFLEAACAGNSERRQRVDALLKAYDDAGSFLQQAAGDWRHPPGAAGEAATAAVDLHGIPVNLLTPSGKPGCLGMLGPYEIQEFIGRGGMGIVLRALDPKLNRIVAVKVLAPELAAQVSARQRFLREARAAAAVSHPHIVTIHAVEEAQLPYLVMECVVGRTLQQKIDQGGALRLKEILRIGTQVGEGLAAAHKQGLVHRDIKPANILLENGVERVKITDFGLARSVDDVALTRTGEVSGTPQYMSPEQALGQRIDHRSDLFSLGCVLYAMCTGRPPFRGDNVAVVVKRICDETPKPIDELNPEIPAWLIETIHRLLAKDPAQRFQTAAEVAEILSGQLAHAQQTAPGRVPPQAARHVPATSAKAAGAALATMPLIGETLAPNWLVLATLAVGNMLVGRILPFDSYQGNFLLWALAIFVPIFVFTLRARITPCPVGHTCWLILGGICTSFLGAVFGSAMHYHHHGLPFGDVFYIVGLAVIVWVYRWYTNRHSATIARAGDTPRPQPPSPSGASDQAAAARPWKVAGWMTVAILGFVLFIPCLLGIGLVWPYLAFRRAETETGKLTIDWDDAAPIVAVNLQGGGVNPFQNFPVTSKPYTIRLPAGAYRAKITYSHFGRKYTIEQLVEVAKQQEKQLDLAQQIERDVQERLKNKGLPVRPLGEQADPTESDDSNGVRVD